MVVADDDLAKRELCIGLSNHKNLFTDVRLTTHAKVPRVPVTFPFVSVIFSPLRENVHFSCEPSYDLYAQIAYHRFHIGKVFQMCVLSEYAASAQRDQ